MNRGTVSITEPRTVTCTGRLTENRRRLRMGCSGSVECVFSAGGEVGGEGLAEAPWLVGYTAACLGRVADDNRAASAVEMRSTRMLRQIPPAAIERSPILPAVKQ